MIFKTDKKINEYNKKHHSDFSHSFTNKERHRSYGNGNGYGNGYGDGYGYGNGTWKNKGLW